MPTPVDSPAPLREPHLLQFRLRQIFGVVTFVSVLCALVALTHGPWPWVIVICALMIAAHVLGNLIGTRLRDTSAEVVRWRSTNPRQSPDDPHVTSPEELAKLIPLPETNLRNFGRQVRGLKWILWAGWMVGATFAGSVVWLTIGTRMSWIGWIVATLSGGIFGTWLVFLAVSFMAIARAAWRQANERDD